MFLRILGRLLQLKNYFKGLLDLKEVQIKSICKGLFNYKIWDAKEHDLPKHLKKNQQCEVLLSSPHFSFPIIGALSQMPWFNTLSTATSGNHLWYLLEILVSHQSNGCFYS